MSDDVQPSPVDGANTDKNTANKLRTRGLRPPFPKGVSGNPGGRPKGTIFSRIRERLQGEDGEKIVKAFLTQAKRGSFKHIEQIINREEGKVPDKTIHSGEVIAKAYVTISPSDWDALSKPKPADAEHQADSGV